MTDLTTILYLHDYECDYGSHISNISFFHMATEGNYLYIYIVVVVTGCSATCMSLIDGFWDI